MKAIEDVEIRSFFLISEGTPYDPYASCGDKSMKGAYRAIGVNRTDFLGIIQMRPDAGEDSRAIEWVAYCFKRI